ncbi:MAG: tyrosine-type recombinase/integrase [Syntrophorhabdales bacterium]|jgi:integrase
MGLLQECPKCKKRMNIDTKICLCGFKIGKAAGKNYWIEFYQLGRRKRERIGPNKTAAEQRLREALKARTEERYIEKDKAARLSLGEVCTWYLALPEVKAKDSYIRDKDFVRHLTRLLGANTKVKDVTPGRVESYQQYRLQEPSPRHPGETIRPATVNKEVTCLKTIFNRAVRHGKLEHNPVEKVKKLQENNVRERVLTDAEFSALIEACPDHLRPLIFMAFTMGMRRSEVTGLTWKEVDLAKGFIYLKGGRTKTDCARAVPIHPVVLEILKALPRPLHTDRVFLYRGKPFGEIKRSFKAACKRAGIEDFVVHDLRHCALNNLRLAGNDYFRIMALSGHKTTACFKRYNLVTEDELKKLKWPSEDRSAGTMDTYMDTNKKGLR